jgi:hypothetical protein
LFKRDGERIATRQAGKVEMGPAFMAFKDTDDFRAAAQLDNFLGKINLFQKTKTGGMQSASVTVGGSAGLLVNDANLDSVSRQKKRRQHADRAGTNYQNFGLVWHTTDLSERA